MFITCTRDRRETRFYRLKNIVNRIGSEMETKIMNFFLFFFSLFLEKYINTFITAL